VPLIGTDVDSAAIIRKKRRIPDKAVQCSWGIDLGPNLSVTGSLATILWLIALRRENLQVSAWSLLKVGVIVMPLALFLAGLFLCFTSR
jgi:Na+/H+ antiporter NhaD/arsenite permease-like protein